MITPCVACVAGGIVSAREIKFWRRSRQASGEAARRMGSGTLTLTLVFLAASLASGGKILFRARLQYRQLRRLPQARIQDFEMG